MAEFVTPMLSLGMITLRGNLADPALRERVQTVIGAPMPARLAVSGGPGGWAGWMAPDEVMIFCAPEAVAGMVAALTAALSGQFALVVDVSDARVGFWLAGQAAAEVLAKLVPLDLHPDTFSVGTMRRTRLGQIAAAIWRAEDGFGVLVFRSVADYAFALLAQSAKDGAVGHFR